MEWKRGELKDCRITIRISGFDLMKLKALAQMKEKRLYSYISEILRQEIHFQEERLATAEPKGYVEE
jgi:predicted DNA binding CopG/RHH family protein